MRYILSSVQVLRYANPIELSVNAVFSFFFVCLGLEMNYALSNFEDLKTTDMFFQVLNQMPCLFQISLTGSCYTTIAITIERFLAIRLPFFIQKHNVKARVFILPIVIYCLVYNSPRFFEYEILYLGCVDFKNGSYSTLEYDQANNITCEFVYTLDYSEMRKTQLYISVSTKLSKIVWLQVG